MLSSPIFAHHRRLCAIGARHVAANHAAPRRLHYAHYACCSRVGENRRKSSAREVQRNTNALPVAGLRVPSLRSVLFRSSLTPAFPSLLLRHDDETLRKYLSTCRHIGLCPSAFTLSERKKYYARTFYARETSQLLCNSWYSC